MKHFGLIFALAAGALFTACSEDVVSTAPSGLNVQQKSSEVKVLFGKKDITSYTTRGCDVNGNIWSFTPEYPTAEEIEGVMAYIASQTNPTSVAWPGYTKYFVQHMGGAHNKYSYTDWNGAKHDNIDGTSSQEFLQVLENSGNWQHVYNFNAGKCDNAATHNSALMTDGFNGAKTLNEYSSSTIQAWCIFYWNGNYYLGFDFSAKKGDGEIPGDGIYDDWVVKIIPGANETPVTPDDDPEDPGTNPGVNPGTDPGTDPGVNPGTDPSTDPGIDPEDPYYPDGDHVEFDVHHQEHKDWNEIKVSIHLRAAVTAKIVIPIEKELQLIPDDFDIRHEQSYEKIAIEEHENVGFQVFDSQTGEPIDCHIPVTIAHTDKGIEITIDGNNDEYKATLQTLQAAFNDGLTFEIHSYVTPETTNEKIWDMLKATECLVVEDVKNYYEGKEVPAFGQITTAHFDEEVVYSWKKD